MQHISSELVLQSPDLNVSEAVSDHFTENKQKEANIQRRALIVLQEA